MFKKNSVGVLSRLICLFLLSGTFLIGCENQGELNQSNNQNGGDSTKSNVVRIGYQKNCPLLILKELGTLEESLENIGYTVEWKEFQAGPALVEALNAGSIDIGRTGNTPPVFSQAAGAPFVYVAAGKPKFQGSGILVPEASNIQVLEDLKGKKVGFAKGSSSHYLIVKALEKAGLTYSDITPAFLSPGDARVAFEQGNIDAWAVWDPYTSDTQINSNARLLVDGEGLTTDRDFFLAHNKFAKGHSKALKIVINEVQKSSDWANTHHEELIVLLKAALKLDSESINLAINRRIYGVDPITKDIIVEQQGIADLFFNLDIIPKKLDVTEVMKETDLD